MGWDGKITRHETDLNTWTYEEQRTTNRPIPYVMNFKAKTNMYGDFVPRTAQSKMRHKM